MRLKPMGTPDALNGTELMETPEAFEAERSAMQPARMLSAPRPRLASTPSSSNSEQN